MSVSPAAVLPPEPLGRAPESRVRALLASPVASIAITLAAVDRRGAGR